MRKLTPLELGARLSAVERRLERLEASLPVSPAPPLHERWDSSLYIWALRLLANPTLGAEEAGLCALAALALDEPRLLAVATATGDPYPWAPILRVLRAAAVLHPSERVAKANLHLADVATKLLDLQGLGIVPVDDILRGPSAPSVAADRITSSR